MEEKALEGRTPRRAWFDDQVVGFLESRSVVPLSVFMAQRFAPLEL
jgi:hypothetical protein